MTTLILIVLAFLTGRWWQSEFGGTWVKGSGHRLSDPSHLRVRIRGKRRRFTDDQLLAARQRELEARERKEGA